MLTQEEWYQKLRGFLPAWFFEEEGYQNAHLYAFALLLQTMEEDLGAHFDETFILEAVEAFLDAHGEERGVIRAPGEFDDQYDIEVQNLTNHSNLPDIKIIVDKLLMVGECDIIEDYKSTIYLNREQFLSRGEIMIDEIYNAFSILVDKQIHAPYSFNDREEGFCDREDYVGMANSSDYVFNLIQSSVDRVKAAGTFYRIIERLEG